MAIGWLSILKSVPWTDVIANAPQVAEGAKKLWNAVGGKSGAAERVSDEGAAGQASGQAAGRLEARVAALESQVADLHGQMLASSELIKSLADQNAQLIARAELNRVRTVRLAWALAVLALVVVIGLGVLAAKAAGV